MSQAQPNTTSPTSLTSLTSHEPHYKLSPSVFGRAFELGCDRQLKLSLLHNDHTPEPWLSLKLASKRAMTDNISMREILASGHAWEREALARDLVSTHLVAPPGSAPLTDRRWGETPEEAINKSLEVLREASVGELIYQLHLSPPQELYSELKLNPETLTLRPNLPDLVQVLSREQLAQERTGQLSFHSWLSSPIQTKAPKSERVFRVIDLKRSAKVKPSHRAQVLYYALELKALLAREGIEGEVDLEWGAVWLGGEEAPELINLKVTAPYVLKAFEGLPELIDQPLEETEWGLSGRCERCEFWSACSAQARKQDHLSRLSGLSESGVKALKALGAEQVSDLPELLEQPEVERATQQVASLARLGATLKERALAHTNDEARPLDRLSQLLPQDEDVAIFLTAQRDPISQGMWALGLCVVTPHRALALPHEPGVFLASSPQDMERVSEAWLSALEHTLERVMDANRQGAGLSVQLYCYSDLERRLVIEALRAITQREAEAHAGGAALEHQRALRALGERAERMLYVVQGAELIKGDQHPKEVKEVPVVPLLSALVGRYALPIDVIYTLPEVSDALELPERYVRDAQLHDPYSHQLRADLILALWRDELKPTPHEVEGESEGERAERALRAYQALRAAAYQKLVDDLSLRLRVYAHLLQRLRAPHPNSQVRSLKSFELPQVERFSHPDLSRLAYLARHELLLDKQAQRQPRFEGAEAALKYNTLTRLVSLGDAKFEVISLPAETAPEVDGFGDLLLVEASDEGLRQAALARDEERSISGDVYAVKVMARVTPHPSSDKESKRLTLGDEITLSTGFPARPFTLEIPKGTELFLCPRFYDFNLKKIITALNIHSRAYSQGDSLFVQLLKEPSAVKNELRYPSAFEELLSAHPLRARLTTSQSNAWERLTRQRVSLVWGPPGTGKTHFLASYINGLLETAQRANRPVVIVVSAMTNLSIDNLLNKVADVAAERAQGDESKLPAEFIRASKRPKAPHPLINYCSDNHKLRGEVSGLNKRRSLVLGATQWKLAVIEKPAELIDLMVIDEASQVLVQEASIGFSKLAREGRVVMAGDHKQLGPVLRGDWSEDEVERRLAGSIFDLARGAERAGKGDASAETMGLPMSQLLENFRMCEPLTTLSKQIYGPHYRCNDDSVATRHKVEPLELTSPDHLPATSTLNALLTCLNLEPTPLLNDPGPFLSSALAPNAFTMVITDGLSASRENPYESALVGLCVEALRLNSQSDDERFWSEELFVIGPHNKQNDLTREALSVSRSWAHPPFVQTVDKAQGQEADRVLISYGVADLEFILSEAEFIYDLNRLNVSITRARRGVVLFVSRQLLEGDLSLLDNPKALAGLTYLRSLELSCRARGEGERFELATLESGVVSLEVISLKERER